LKSPVLRTGDLLNTLGYIYTMEYYTLYLGSIHWPPKSVYDLSSADQK
jgi:hypothetical protein